MMKLPLGNRALNDLLPDGGLLIPDSSSVGPHWPHVVLETGPAGLGKTTLASSTACQWAARLLKEQPDQYVVIYVTPHWPAISFQKMVQELVAASLGADSSHFDDLKLLRDRWDAPRNFEQSRQGSGDWITTNLLYHLAPLGEPTARGGSVSPADSRLLGPLLRLSNDTVGSNRRIILFIDSLSPVGVDQVNDIIRTLRHPELMSQDYQLGWQKLAVLWLIYDGEPSLTSQLEHLSHTVIRFHLPDSGRYWSPSIEIAKASQPKIHGRHQVKLRVRHEGANQPSKTVELHDGLITLSEYGWQGSGWLEVWHSMAYTLSKSISAPRAIQELRKTAFEAINSQIGGIKPGSITAILGGPGAGKRPLAIGFVAPGCLSNKDESHDETALAILFRDTRTDLKQQYRGLDLQDLSVLRIQPGDIRPDEFIGLVHEALGKLDAVNLAKGKAAVSRVLIDDVSLIPTLFPLCFGDVSFLTALLQCCSQGDRSVVVLGTAVATSAPIIDALRTSAQYVVENRVSSEGTPPLEDRSVLVNLISAPGASTKRPALLLTVNEQGVPSVTSTLAGEPTTLAEGGGEIE